MPDLPDPTKRVRRNDPENPAWIRHQPDLPEEAVEAVKQAVDFAYEEALSHEHDPPDDVECARISAEAAAPAIRKQEQERVEEQLREEREQRQMSDRDWDRADRRAGRHEQTINGLAEALVAEIERLRNWDSKAINAEQAHEETADRLEAVLAHSGLLDSLDALEDSDA